MTPRSTKQQHPKTTTISRRLRYRADQLLSNQSSEIPQLRSVRPRRAATLPEPRHDPLDSQRQNLPQNLVAWETADFIEGPQSSRRISHSASVIEQSVDQLLAQTLDFSPHSSPQGSCSALVSTEPRTIRDYQQAQYPQPGLPPSPLPSVSSNFDFEAPLPSTDPQQSHHPFIDLQDMR
jgi:hypothetical protein